MNSFKSYTLLNENVNTINKFVDYCYNSLNIDQPCNIKFVDHPTEEMTTGCFNPNDREIKVVSGPRALVDILRSLAHELVHAKQHEDGRLDSNSGEDGSPIENEANSIAGVLMRRFQRENRNIYDE